MRKYRPASETVLTAGTKSRLETPHSCGAWWLCKIKAGPFCVQQPTKRRIWTKSLELEYIYPVFQATPRFSFPYILNTPPAIINTASILNCLDITWLAQNNAYRSKTHLITYTTLYVHSGLPSATFNCIIMVTPWMWIHFQLAAMAPKGSRKGKGKPTAKAKMPTSVINWRLSLDQDRIKGFIWEHIRGLIWIYNVCGVKDERAWDLFYDIILLDPVKTHHISQFQLMWPHRRSRRSPFRE